MIAKTPRTPRSDGERSRRTILEAAASLATVEGLEGMSIARLAEHIGMSKSGLYAHFGSKEELQLATVDTAGEIFRREVVLPANDIADPVEHLEALFENFLLHLERRVFPGGCFFISALAELDTRPGAVRQRASELADTWLDIFVGLIEAAQAQGTISNREDARQLAWELDSYLVMANMGFVLKDDPVVLEAARVASKARLQHARAP